MLLSNTDCESKRLKNFFVILLLVSISTLPLNAKAVTLQEYENEVAKYQAQINEKKAQLAKNNETIASVQAKIKYYQSQITKNEEEQYKINSEVLSKVTGEFGVLEAINSR